MRQWDTTKIVEWLESPQGEIWSREHHNSIPGIFVSAKGNSVENGILIFTNVDYNNAENLASSI